MDLNVKFSSKQTLIAAIAGLLAVDAVIGIASGGVAGWYTAVAVQGRVTSPGISASSTTGVSSTHGIVTTTPTATLRLVPLSEQAVGPRLLPEVISNRQSPVASVYLHKKSVGEGPLRDEDVIARAAALTSDGWFAVPAVVLENIRIADIVIWHGQHAYAIERAVSDASSQTVFLKTNARDLPVVPFAQTSSVRNGMAVWFEPDAEHYMPSSVMALRAADKLEVRSSDRADRRLLVVGSSSPQERGAPIWDTQGALLGIVESSNTGRLMVIPAWAISASFQTLVSFGEVRHASLGMMTVDLTVQRTTVLSDAKDMPTRGALIREVKKGSVAEKAGLKIGDVILQVDRDILDSNSNLGDVLMQYHPDSSVTLRIWRKSKESDLPVKLGTQVTSQLLP